MKRNIVFILSAFLLVQLFYSCSDSFIDVEPTEEITIEDLSEYNNDKGAESFVTAIYSKFLDWDMSSFSWIGVTSIISDNADKGSSPGDTGGDKDVLDQLTFTATTPAFNEVWEAHFKVINRTNQALEIIPQLDGADDALRERLLAEAKFFRGFAYFNLVRMFGGVPLIDRVPEVGNENDETMLVTRVSEEEIYHFIENDLKEAAEVLPVKAEYSSENIGRASKGAANALLAKVYLYQEKWQEVVDQTEKIDDYSLTPDYADIFRESGENNEESIFEIQGKGGDSQPGIQQYSEVQGARGAGGWGWGFNTPSQNLVDAFDAEGDNVRKEATIIITGSGGTLYDGRPVEDTWENPYYNYKAYDPIYLGDPSTNTNIRYLRYAEVLLMKAEALNELGSTPDALVNLNKIRNRVNLPEVNTSDQDNLRKAIWAERRLELAMEHDRWFDIVRTGQAEEAMAADGKNFEKGKHELFPIPDDFIRESKGTVEQNPGY